MSVNFGENVFNNKCWNKNKCRCECKELIDKEVCDKGFIWNPGYCECECDKACDVDEYLDYENCKCRKKLVHKLVDECTETVEEVKLAKITFAENESANKYSSCAVYTVLMIVVFTIFTGITTYFVYYNCFLLKIMFFTLNLVLIRKQRFGKLIKWEKSNKLTLKIKLIIFTMIKLI